MIERINDTNPISLNMTEYIEAVAWENKNINPKIEERITGNEKNQSNQTPWFIQLDAKVIPQTNVANVMTLKNWFCVFFELQNAAKIPTYPVQNKNANAFMFSML